MRWDDSFGGWLGGSELRRYGLVERKSLMLSYNRRVVADRPGCR
jgi:hypothetical protein